MNTFIDEHGKQYGRLTVLSLHQRKRVKWRCQCLCGTQCIVAAVDLRSGHTTSCGCVQRERTRDALTIHGEARKGSHSREYRSWSHMKGRCHNPHDACFNEWGGRGIQVCEAWRTSFQQFLTDMGQCPEGMTLDRIDNNGNYEPGNCRWATRSQQALNRHFCRYHTLDDERISISQMAHHLAMPYSTLMWELWERGV